MVGINPSPPDGTTDGGGPPPGFGTIPAGPVQDNGPRTVIIVWVLVALSTVFMGLRFYCKARFTKGYWYDDWVLLASWLTFLVDAAMTSAVVGLGFGKLPMFIPRQNFPLMGLYANVGQTFGILAVVWSKTSFAFTLLRLIQGKIKAFVWFVIITLNVFFSLLALFTWVQCTPVSKTWNKQMKGGTCWDVNVVNGYNLFTAVYSGIMDIVLAMLPWVIIWNLQMRLREKIGVGIAMSMGVFAGSTAFIKASKVNTIGSENFTLEGCELLLWAGAEIGTTIMACCIPSMRVLFREVGVATVRAYGSYGSKSTGSKTGRSGGSHTRTVIVGSRQKDLFSIPSPMRPDDLELSESESQREILPMQGCHCRCHSGHTTAEPHRKTEINDARGAGKIIRTQAFDVEYRSNAGSKEMLEYQATAVAM